MSKTASKSRKSRKSSETSVNKEQLNMQIAHESDIDLSADDAIIASMLNDINDGASDIVATTDESAIEAAVAEIEKAEAIEAIYAEQPAPAPSEVATTEKKAKAPKAPKPPRITYVGHKPSEVLIAKLGDKASEMLILEVDDATLVPGRALQAKQAELLAGLNARPGTSDSGSTQKKVAEKIVMLFGWLKNGGKLNEVMERTIRVLARDGEIVSGDKGNLHAELLAKPYSVGTARAQAGQMMAMLPMLKIATKSEKGKLVANPNSMILMAAKAQLGL